MSLVTPAAAIILQALVAMALLHAVVLARMMSLRVPALIRMRIDPQKITQAVLDTLPQPERMAAGNYRNLSEAPPVFYALSIALVLLGKADAVLAIAAVSYVALRVLHSAIHLTFNRVKYRFYAFASSWAVLGFMTLYGLYRVVFA